MTVHLLRHPLPASGRHRFAALSPIRLRKQATVSNTIIVKTQRWRAFLARSAKDLADYDGEEVLVVVPWEGCADDIMDLPDGRNLFATVGFHADEDGEPYQVEIPAVVRWLVITGETGPIHPQWVRWLVTEAQGAGISVWFDSWGSWAPKGQGIAGVALRDRKHHGHIHTEEPGFVCVGRDRSGWLLDGKEIRGVPHG